MQGYVYAAMLARAHFADEAGDDVLATDLRKRAVELRERFNQDFWMPERGWLALGLDGDKRPIDVCASNMGHCLWTGILEPAKAEQVASASCPRSCSAAGACGRSARRRPATTR